MEEFDFVPATTADKDAILNVALDEFIREEPHSVALGFTRENCFAFLDYIVTMCLHFPHNLIVREKATGEIAAIRLMSEAHRDKALDYSPYELDMAKLDERVLILDKLIDSVKEQIWTLRPEANLVLRSEIVFVNPRHQRKGIARTMLNDGLDYAQLRAAGFDGIQAEASSHANQQLLALNGYERIYESDPEQLSWPDGTRIQLHDATTCYHLMYKSLH